VSDNESYRYDPDFSPTPNGTSYWRPDLPEDEKPKLGDIFDTFDDGYNMYKVYSDKCRFNIRKSGIKRYKGKVTHRYVLCNKAGKLRSKFDINTLKEADTNDEEKNGPTLAHRLKVALMGGYDKVRGTPDDYRNFKRAVNLFIRDRDAQMIVDKMINRKLHVLEFSFEHHVLHDELVSRFWADDTMKCNYVVFSDVVSFDATFRTNKYNFVFVPFTGIDHNQKCVTFGSALLSDETEDSYCWMLKAFLKVHQKQPTLALTDQDVALRNVVVTMFPDSKHRLSSLLLGIKCSKPFPLSVMNSHCQKKVLTARRKFPLLVYLATASEEIFPLLS
nr:protein FAR1-related sequence 5-like [Tanacetum cinerariifolium]